MSVRCACRLGRLCSACALVTVPCQNNRAWSGDRLTGRDAQLIREDAGDDAAAVVAAKTDEHHAAAQGGASTHGWSGDIRKPEVMQDRPPQSAEVPVTEQAKSVSGTAGCRWEAPTPQDPQEHLTQASNAPELGDRGLCPKFICVAHWSDAESAVSGPVHLGGVVLISGSDGTLLAADVRTLDGKVFHEHCSGQVKRRSQGLSNVHAAQAKLW